MGSTMIMPPIETAYTPRTRRNMLRGRGKASRFPLSMRQNLTETMTGNRTMRIKISNLGLEPRVTTAKHKRGAGVFVNRILISHLDDQTGASNIGMINVPQASTCSSASSEIYHRRAPGTSTVITLFLCSLPINTPTDNNVPY